MAAIAQRDNGITSGINNFQQLLDIFKGSATDIDSTNTSTEQVSAEKATALLTQMLGSTSGLAAVASGQKNAGLYNSSTNQLLVNDLLARTAGQVAALSSVKTSNTSTKQTKEAQANAGKTAAAAGLAALAKKLLGGGSGGSGGGSGGGNKGGGGKDNSDSASDADVSAAMSDVANMDVGASKDDTGFSDEFIDSLDQNSNDFATSVDGLLGADLSTENLDFLSGMTTDTSGDTSGDLSDATDTSTTDDISSSDYYANDYDFASTYFDE